MIVINEQYKDHFKPFGWSELVYEVVRGVYLAFDKHTLEYIGVETMFLPKDSTWIQTKCDENLNELLTRGILEIAT